MIDEYDTLDAAETALESYIADDRANGEYTPRYHEIYDSHTEKIITVA